MNKKDVAKKVAAAALVGILAATSLTACETIFKAGDAAAGKSSCKGSSSCKGKGSCSGK